MRLFAISGSLRAQSSNAAALKAAAILAPSQVEFVLYDGLGNLPHFNPDLDTERPPEAVIALRCEITRCDGLIICSPEYAHGVAGSMKRKHTANEKNEIFCDGEDCTIPHGWFRLGCPD